jgi:hypothetical protein
MRAVAERVMLSAQRGLIDLIVATSWMIGTLAIGLAGILHGEGRWSPFRLRHRHPALSLHV